MKLNEYQVRAMKFAKYTTNDYPFLALSEEAGEVMGKLAKHMRKSGCSLSTTIYDVNNGSCDTSIALRDNLKKELGDVFWQFAACCSELGFDIDDVAVGNLEKLGGRSERGTIVGEGDER